MFMFLDITQKGQVSLEYLLILSAFFSVFALILPIISFSVDQLFVAIDTVTAKQIIQTLKENDELFMFLSNNSYKKLEFIPSKEINILINQNKVFISCGEKKFELALNDSQVYLKKTFTEKFYLELKKENNLTKINFYN